MPDRVGRLHQAFRVVRVIPEGCVGVTLILDGDLPAQPGQFVMAWLPGVEERPFSVMDDHPLSLTVAEVGPFTHALCSLQPGNRLWVRGPFGHGFELTGRRHLLVGGGSGAAGLTLLAKQARSRGDEVLVVLGARTAEQLMLCWHLAGLGCPIIIATDDGSAGYRGTAVEAVLQYTAGFRSLAPCGRLGWAQGPGLPRLLESTEFACWPDTVYGCGPQPMLWALARWAAEMGLPCWVSLERVMRCGIGVCGSCHVGDRLVCRDGPVFAAQQLLPFADSIS